MKILFENCDPQKAEDRELPNNSFIIEYNNGGAICYDIAAAAKQSEIFDHYYDKYKKGFVTMKQTEGRINPKLYGYEGPKTKKKK
mgnify:FL=1|tara:strand:+ start:655 stop:909 length:255 start_codon:yes stop_codon:yes gene_type:complete